MARLKSEDLNVNIRVHSSDARQRILDLETGIRDETAQLKHLQNELKKVEKAEGANSAVAREKRSQIEALTTSIKKNKDALSRQRERGELTTRTGSVPVSPRLRRCCRNPRAARRICAGLPAPPT